MLQQDQIMASFDAISVDCRLLKLLSDSESEQDECAGSDDVCGDGKSGGVRGPAPEHM